MDDQHGAAWPDVMLRRPAVDPAIPGRDRALLTAPGTFLTPASRNRPGRTRDYLPADPGKRGTTIDGAVLGMTAAGFIAVGGATPYAIGVLIFQGPAGWQAASGRWALLVAEIIAVVTAVVFGARILRFGQLTGSPAADVAARAYHGRYLTGADFDARSRVLLRRAQDAVDAVTSAEVYRAGLLDAPALAEQEWDIAVALREHARLRVARAELVRADAETPDAETPEPGTPEAGTAEPGTAAAAVLASQAEAARAADASIADRVAALERYADEVRSADAAYRDWQQAAALAKLNDRHLDMLARTAADELGIAEIEAMSQQARAVRLALRELCERPGSFPGELPREDVAITTRGCRDYHARMLRLARKFGATWHSGRRIRALNFHNAQIFRVKSNSASDIWH
jgi:hypothetical protein